MVQVYNTNISVNKNKLISFLNNNDLSYDDDIDLCLVIKNNDEIVASACLKDNVFKMIAVDEAYQAMDYVAKLISELIAICHQKGIFHYFIFTKEIYFNHFRGLGFRLLVSFEKVGLLEYGQINFQNYYLKYQLDANKNNGAIVMNCNPFTLGHRYLIESAALMVDQLVIFVVEENKSYFNFEDRLNLVKKGVEDLSNVIVIPSGPYIISSATFPTYFLKSIDEQTYYYTNIDLLLFKKIMEQMNLQKRFFGEEPQDNLTNYYLNQARIVLDNHICIIERIKYQDKVISASLVRKYLENQDFELIKPLVNNFTYQYLLDNFRKDDQQ